MNINIASNSANHAAPFAGDCETTFEPFPYGFIEPVFSQAQFDRLACSFPSAEDMLDRQDLGDKMVLNEHRNTSALRNFLKRERDWACLYEDLKRPQFVAPLLRRLRALGLDLGIEHLPVVSPNVLIEDHIPIPDEACESGPPRIEVRVEFFRQPMPQGSHLPHTDRPGKLLTLLVGMNRDAWPSSSTGQISLCHARDPRRSYNYCNRYLELSEVTPFAHLEHRPNRANFLVKTHNSLHAVFPSVSNTPLPDRLTFVVQLYVFPTPFR